MTVVQAVMLYGLETWVVTPHIGRVLDGFHHRVARRLMVRQHRRGRYSLWVYPSIEDVLVEAVLQEVETYVSLQQNTVAQFISTRPIMDLFLVTERRPGSRVEKWWWEQDGLDLEGVWAAYWGAKRTEKEKDTYMEMETETEE